jgi:dynein heavy chain
MGEWSQMQLSEVKIEILVNGINNFELALLKLPHKPRTLPPYEFIRQDLARFKESLPIFQDLKNEALRERHQAEMMANAVTLANIFKMNLTQYADVIADVTNIPTKELGIERGIEEVAVI